MNVSEGRKRSESLSTAGGAVTDRRSFQPGARVRVYAGLPHAGVCTRELHVGLGGEVYSVLVDGETETCEFSWRIVVTEAAFQQSWHVYVGNEVVAGGPSIPRARADELAVKYGGQVVQGEVGVAKGAAS